MPTTLAGRAAPLRNLGDRNRRRVGGEDGVGPGHLLRVRQHRSLQVEVFEHGFDHEVDPGQVVVARGSGHLSFHGEPGIGLLHPPPFHLPIQDLLDVVEPAADAGVVDLLDDRADLGPGGVDGRNAAPHETATENADGFDRAGLGLAGDPWIALQFLRRKEDGSERQRLG